MVLRMRAAQGHHWVVVVVVEHETASIGGLLAFDAAVRMDLLLHGCMLMRLLCVVVHLVKVLLWWRSWTTV